MSRSYVCPDCGATCTIELSGIPDNPENTLCVFCPVCRKIIYAESCFGFGAVYPAHIFEGNRLIAELHSSNGSLVMKSGDKISELKLPAGLAESTYEHHFDICRFVYDSYFNK